MTTITLLLVSAALALGLSRMLRLPAIPLLVMAGWAIGHYGGMLTDEFMQNALELGLVFLVFAAGVELNPRRVKKHTSGVVWVGLVQFFVLGVLGYLLSVFLGYGHNSALFMAFALSASSTLVVIRCLKQRQQMFEPFGRLVTGVLLLQDILIVVGLVVLIRLPEGLEAVATGLGTALVLGGAAWIAHRFVMPYLILIQNPDEELMLLVVMSLLFLFTGCAWLLDLPLVAGAFLAGYALSSFPVNGLVRGMLLSLNDFFLAIFFLALGALITLPSLEMLKDVLVFTLFILIVTVPLVAWIAEKSGYSARTAIESGLLLSQTSEFSLIVALYGWTLGQISPEMFSVIALLTVVTMTLTPFIATDQITWHLMRLHPMRLLRQTAPEDLQQHIILIGYGSAGDAILRALKDTPSRVVVIDDDAAVIKRLRERGYICLQGDGTDDDVLDLARARKAAVIISSMRRENDTLKITDYLRHSSVPVVVRVMDEETGQRLKQAGASPVVMVNPTVDLLLEWLQENTNLDKNLQL
jgi:Kef-type K+ transport system membrane component KefB